MRGRFVTGVVIGAALIAGCQHNRPSAAPTVAVSTPPVVVTPTPTPTVRATPRATPTPKHPAVPSPVSRPVRPPFSWSMAPVTAASLGKSWHQGCPVGPSQLRRLTLPYVNWDGHVRTGAILVNARVVSVIVGVFRDLYSAGFPIRSLTPVDAYGGDDNASMAADNTSGFNCRDVPGTTSWSEHAYGLAVDVDPLENPYLPGDGTVQPPAGRRYLNRSARTKGMAYPGGVLVEAFLSRGWHWGGSWSNPDYQHFSWNGK